MDEVPPNKIKELIGTPEHDEEKFDIQEAQMSSLKRLLKNQNSDSKNTLEKIRQASLQGLKSVSEELSKKFDSARKVVSKRNTSTSANKYEAIEMLHQ